MLLIIGPYSLRPTRICTLSFLIQSHKNIHFLILETLFYLMSYEVGPILINNTLVTFSFYLSLTLPIFALKPVPNPKCIFFRDGGDICLTP